MKRLLLTILFLANVYFNYAQTGATCSEAHEINQIPFLANGLITIGTAYNSLPCSGSGFTNYMSGKDYVFVFTPTQSANYFIKLTNTSPSVGLFVIDKCPNDPSVQCIANNNSPLGNPSLTVSLTAGNTYYIVVSSINFITPQTNFNIEIQMCLGTPVASFSYIQNGLTVQFINTSQEATSYLWYFGDELIPPPFSPGDTNTNPIHTYLQYGDYVITLIAYNACGQSDTLIDTISVICPGNLPQANFSYSVNGLQVSFFNQSTDATSYRWFFGDEILPFLPSDTTENPTHTYAQYGTYNVKLVALNECGSDTIVITIVLECPGNMPMASFTYNILSDGTVEFTSTSTDATQWKWFFGDFDYFPLLPGDTVENPTHTYLFSGTYTVYLIVYNECGSDTISQNITIVITKYDNNEFSNIRIYPNPVKENVFISGINNFSYTVYNLYGHKLVEKHLNTCNIINFSKLEVGTYVLEIKQNLGIKRFIIIKE